MFNYGKMFLAGRNTVRNYKFDPEDAFDVLAWILLSTCKISTDSFKFLGLYPM